MIWTQTMKVGDLVRYRNSMHGVVALVTRIEFAPNFYKSVTKPTEWVFLSGQDVPFRAHRLEVISA
jgi:hypothetical protein